MVVAFLCVLNITVMSSFLSQFLDRLFALSPYNCSHDFKDHVVLIGKIASERIKDFMDELVENDVVERRRNHSMGLMSIGIKCIIISNEEPNNALRLRALYYGE